MAANLDGQTVAMFARAFTQYGLSLRVYADEARVVSLCPFCAFSAERSFWSYGAHPTRTITALRAEVLLHLHAGHMTELTQRRRDH